MRLTLVLTATFLVSFSLAVGPSPWDISAGSSEPGLTPPADGTQYEVSHQASISPPIDSDKQPQARKALPLDLNKEPRPERTPISIQPKGITGGDHRKLMGLIRKNLRPIRYVRTFHIRAANRDQIRHELFEQMIADKSRRAVLPLKRVRDIDGNLGWAVAYPMRSNDAVKRLYPRRDLLWALVEVYPLRSNPYMHLLGHGSTDAAARYALRDSRQAERLDDLLVGDSSVVRRVATYL